jgi:hypothetical protein
VEALLGILHLLFIYIVSDTIHQTSLGTKSSVKNAVSLLVKISTKNIAERTGTSYLQKNKLPPDLILYIAKFFKNSKYTTKAYWILAESKKDNAITTRLLKPEDQFIEGDYADFVIKALGGKESSRVAVTIGKKELEKPDVLPDDVQSESYGQAGIPVEHRRIAAQPTINGLYEQMKKIIDQTRTLNLQHVSSDTRAKVLNRVSTTEKRKPEDRAESHTSKESKFTDVKS